jgi:hypothetical protein
VRRLSSKLRPFLFEDRAEDDNKFINNYVHEFKSNDHDNSAENISINTAKNPQQGNGNEMSLRNLEWHAGMILTDLGGRHAE